MVWLRSPQRNFWMFLKVSSALLLSRYPDTYMWPYPLEKYSQPLESRILLMTENACILKMVKSTRLIAALVVKVPIIKSASTKEDDV